MYIDLFSGTLAAARSVNKLAGQLLRIGPPSSERTWTTAGQLLPERFPDYEYEGQAKLQNDVLLHLTARGHGARLDS